MFACECVQCHSARMEVREQRSAVVLSFPPCLIQCLCPCVSQATWPASFQRPSVSASHFLRRGSWDYIWLYLASFSMGSGNLNSGCQACLASAFSMEASLQPSSLYFRKRCIRMVLIWGYSYPKNPSARVSCKKVYPTLLIADSVYFVVFFSSTQENSCNVNLNDT